MTIPDFYADEVMPLLTPEQFAVLVQLARLVGGGMARVSAKRLSEASGLAAGSVRRALDVLEGAKLIKVLAPNDPHFNAGCEYRLDGGASGEGVRWEYLRGLREERLGKQKEKAHRSHASRGLYVGHVYPPDTYTHPTPPPVYMSDTQTPLALSTETPSESSPDSEESPSGMSQGTDPSPSEKLILTDEPQAPMREEGSEPVQAPGAGLSGVVRAAARAKEKPRQPHRVEGLDYTTKRAFDICVERVSHAWADEVKRRAPDGRGPVVAVNDRQAVKNAARGLQQNGTGDWFEIEAILAGCVVRLAEEGRPLSALSWRLNALLNPTLEAASRNGRNGQQPHALTTEQEADRLVRELEERRAQR